MAFKEYEDPELLRAVQRIAKDVLAEFDRVCRLLDIPYVAYGGTALGAVRHKGFIPWDDDVDVALTRADYERFLREAPAVLGEQYEIHNVRNHDDFAAVFSFLIRKGTLFVQEDVKDNTYRKPIGIDLFPLDNISDDPDERRKQCRETWFWGRLMYLRATPRPNVALTGWKRAVAMAIMFFAHWGMRLLHIGSPWIQKRWERAARRFEHQQTDLMADFSDLDPMAWSVTADEMYSTIDAPFEDITIKLPRDFDEILTRGYGDYMQLPPPDKRKNHAPHLIDLGTRQTMKIAFVVNNYPPKVGGLEMHVSALARNLHQRGHSVSVVTLADEPGRADEDGIKVIRLRESTRIGDVLGFPPLGTTRRLKRLLLDGGFDLVSVHTRFFPLTWLGVRAARACRIPVIETEHGSDHVTSDSPIIAVASRLVDLTFGRCSLRRANRVVGVSENAVAFVRRLAGVDAQVFYNAIDLPAEDPEVVPHPERLVFVGRLVSGKGWDTFMEVVAGLRAKGIEVTGDVLGNGPDEDKARSVAPDGVTVHGRVTPAEVGVHLKGATLVNPTVLSEGFQTTLLEALAAGGRVVTFDVPGARVLADDGAPVVVTDRRDTAAMIEAVESVLADPGELYPRAKLEKWSWQNRAAQFEQIGQQLTA